MKKKKSISVVIPCFNVDKFIRPTLDSIRWCDEVLIIDMFSTDKTKEICSEYPNIVFIERKDYIYGNVNFGIEQAKSDWVMRLDSDEVITENLKNEIINDVLTNENCEYDGFDIRQDPFFMGYHIEHGFGHDNWRGMLFKKGKASYKLQTEHEDLTKIGKWGRLNSKYYHYTNPTISKWVEKINYYSDKEMERWNPTSEPPITMFKVIYRTLRWLQRYLTHPYWAIKDGVPGIVVGLIAAAGLMLGFLKQWEKQQKHYKGRSGFPEHPNAWSDK